MIIGTFHRSALAVISRELAGELKLSGVALGTLSSFFFWAYTVMQVPSGYFVDDFGSRIIVTLGLVLVGSGGIFFSLANSFLLAALGRILLGIGCAGFFLALVRIQAKWFSASCFATLTGLAAFLSDGGSLLAGSPFAFVVEKLGWRLSYAGLSIASLAMAWLAWLVVRDQPDNTAVGGAALPREHYMPPGYALKSVLTNRDTWPPFLAVLGLNSTFLTFHGVWSVPYLTQVYGFDLDKSATYLTVMAIGIMLGGLASGYLADLCGRLRLVLLMFLGSYTASWAAFVIFHGKPPETWLYPLLFFVGFFPGSMILAFTCAKDANPGELSALATGIVNTGNFLALALLQPLTGWVLDASWLGTVSAGMRSYPLFGYLHMFLLFLTISLVSFGGALLVRHE